jgi:hypothetical protein
MYTFFLPNFIFEIKCLKLVILMRIETIKSIIESLYTLSLD